MSLAPLPFRTPWLLAPMEGVTDPVFRSLVLALHEPEGVATPTSQMPGIGLGGAFTEFLRVSINARTEKDVRRHTGPRVSAIPVGLQLMGNDDARMADSARAAIRAGAPVVDINFGCPAKGALKGCAGASMLQSPGAMESLVRTVARAVEEESQGRIPTTAKIRAGYDHAEDVESLSRAVEAGGAALLTVHCRTRSEGYCPETDWSRLERSAAAVSIPVCGNGGIERFADLERMRRETGCAYGMVGRAALGDPWLFSDRSVSTQRCAEFLLDYARAIKASGPVSYRGIAGRIKQLLRLWTAGDLVPTEAARKEWLTEADPMRLIERLESIAGLEAGATFRLPQPS